MNLINFEIFYIDLYNKKSKSPFYSHEKARLFSKLFIIVQPAKY